MQRRLSCRTSGSRRASAASCRQINLAFDASGFTVLVSLSGCEKSMTFRILAGLESPDAGESCFNGSLIRYFAPMDRDITMVFQDHAPYPPT